MGRKKKNEIPQTRSFETFLELSDYAIETLTKVEPYCINGKVRIRKYKVTIELVEEPCEVLGARLQHLWDTTNNPHHWGDLKAKAQEIGYEIQDHF